MQSSMKYVSTSEPFLKKHRITSEEAIDPLLSVDDATSRLKLNPRLRGEIANSVLKNEIHGNPQAYHQLIKLYIKCKDYENAYKICKYAINTTAGAPLLYTDLIEVCTYFEDPVNRCGDYIDILLKSDRKHWDRRLFWVVFEYFHSLVKNNLLNGTSTVSPPEPFTSPIVMVAFSTGSGAPT